jgi:hypothetical protein
MARKPMGQDEKDKIGQAEMTRRRLEAGERLPDDQLDGLSRDELAAQAGLRGVEVKANATSKDIISALRG